MSGSTARELRGGRPNILFDFSRLLSRARRSAPTGIDRVEFAYARHLLAETGVNTEFVTLGRVPGWNDVDPALAARFLASMASAWNVGEVSDRTELRRLGGRVRLHRLLSSRGKAGRSSGRSSLPPVYLNISHIGLEWSQHSIELLKSRLDARFICLIHDLLPLEYPEYFKPKEFDHHQRRMQVVARLADGIIFTSTEVQDSFSVFARRLGTQAPPSVVSHLGAEIAAKPLPAIGDAPPYFVCVCTIEPRKNHLLLLHLWRRLAASRQQDLPRLVLVGYRGWENENILDLIDRCPALVGLVEEHNRLPDAELTRLMLGARALLMPSFAEGFGLPIVEAMALGVPVICSDIPVHREVGENVPEFIDPLDGLGWLETITDYAQADSARRAAQLRRLAARPTRTWADHMATALSFIEECRRRPA